MFLGAYGEANTFCPLAFERKKQTIQEENTLNLAIQAEELFKDPRVYQQKNGAISQLLMEIESILTYWKNTKYPLNSNEFIILKRKIQRAENILRQPTEKPSEQQTEPSWEELIEDPSLIRANTPYFIEWPDMSGTAYILFNNYIVDTFFSPKRNSDFQSNHIEVARRNINALVNGYTNGDSTGIRILRRNQKQTADPSTRKRYNKLFEIRTLGKTAGHIRIGGFIHKDKLYIVSYITGAHNKTRHSLVDILQKKQSHFIQSGVY